jgi:hypothetical protein
LSLTSLWPILERAAQPPEGWPGWPEGKRFALVLTHDVEGRRGLERVRRLAGLEMELGFRSSFNLIPEGDYRPSRALRQWLGERGFEVGVHDLHHDGSLFRSAKDFQRQAPRINYYLKAWGAVGFRAGFMFHNLDWMGQLELGYDASTFDTDPFEPQPEGVGTIFPFWVPAQQGRSGYVELPYTLVQDSTLFLLLQEPTAQVWKRKLDWLAHQGGMALVNVHPDYLSFAGEAPCERQFAVERYLELLTYVAERYAAQYWHVLPRQLAQWFRAQAAPSVLASR